MITKGLRAAALAVLAGTMTVVMIVSWGSIGSAVMAFGLITMGAALLYQRFLNREDPDQWDNL